MTILMLALLQSAAPVGQLPPNFQRIELQRCVVQTTKDTFPCLLRSMGAEEGSNGADQAVEMFMPANAKYLSAIEQVVREDFKLDDPQSPLSRDLMKKGVYSQDQAPRIILADFRARVQGKGFDYARLAREMKDKAAATGNRERITAGPVSLDRCKRPDDPPGTVIVSCVQNADGTLAVNRRTPNAAPPPTSAAPGALPAGIPAGSTSVALDQCKSSTPLPEGVVLKACWRLPDGRFARQAERAGEVSKN